MTRENASGSAGGSGSGRIGWPCLAGLLAGIPAGWLLAYLAALPAFLGLFFYLLFGLLLGAIMVRCGRRAGPVPRPTLWLIGGGIALLVWATGLAAEYWELPRSAEEAVRKSFIRSFTRQDRQVLADKTREYVNAHLQTEYPPGGFLGYLRWAATDGTMDLPRVFSDTTEVFRLPQRRVAWLVRLALGLLFLGGTIMAQLLELAARARPAGEAGLPGEPPGVEP